MWITLYGTQAFQLIPSFRARDRDYIQKVVAELRQHPDCAANARPFVVAISGNPYIVMRPHFPSFRGKQ